MTDSPPQLHIIGLHKSYPTPTEPLVVLRYFGPDVNPDAPTMGAYRKNKFN